MKWTSGDVDFRKPIKVWSSGGQWQETKLIAVVNDYAIVRVKRPIGEWVYDGLDLKWYRDISGNQLRNLKDSVELPKRELFKIWLASLVMEWK